MLTIFFCRMFLQTLTANAHETAKKKIRKLCPTIQFCIQFRILALHFFKKVKNRITLIYINLIQSKQETLQKKLRMSRESREKKTKCG
jgi:hypothetical protein